jgi:hypothetical protein
MFRPVEQRDPELTFELLDLLAQSRLGQVDSSGGAAEVQLFRNRHEVPEVSEFHNLT